MAKNLIFILYILVCAALSFVVAGCKSDSEVSDDHMNIDPKGYTSPEKYPDLDLVWSDEFNDGRLDTSHWSFEIGGHGWGNNELQFYQEDNTKVRDGFLIITARKESREGKDYTSSRIITKGKKEFQYGRIDIRAKLPKGQGIWPALWMLGNNISTVDWPACGEIDIMEMIGGKENMLHGTAHWDSAGMHTYHGGNVLLKDNKIFADEFHVFSIDWNQEKIVWSLDGVPYYTMNISREDQTEFQNKFYFIFNVAVGGNWPGSPNETTVFPQQLIVDYVRVFQ
jgi:beta-glucanase (GH16 family)